MTSLKLLLIEDSEDDALLLELELRKGGFDTDLLRVETPVELESALDEKTWDAVIADYNLPAFTGVDALRIIQTKGLDLPFILVSGVIGEENAVEAMKAGAHDFIIKGNYARLAPALERELEDAAVRRERREAVEALRLAHAELEQRVAERTAELKQANDVLLAEMAERERAEGALRESRQQNEFLANIIELSSQPFGVGFPDGRLGIVNKAFEQLTGYSAAELKSLDWAETLTPPEWREVEHDELEELQRTGLPVRYEKEYVRKDGTRVPVELLVHLVTEAAEKPEYYYAFVTDITVRKQTEQALLKAKEAAEAANRAKSRFLDNMSHELRTPMTGILGMLDLVLLGNLEAEQREFIDIARTSALSLVWILNDILDMTKIETDKFSIEEKPFSIRNCVESTFNIFLPASKSKGLDFDFTVADDVPDTLIGDRSRINQVLTNLAGNAVKFTEKGYVEILVTTGGNAPCGKREITFSVTDSGIGIPGDKKDLIFGVFSQVDDTDSRKYGGTGLGLAVSKEIVERMGGTISFTSKEGEGSTFSFTIPLGEAEPEQGAVQASAITAPAGDALHAKETTKRSLLVAEDDHTIRQVLGPMLRMFNYEIDFAEDGQKAVEMWECGKYDLVLMDVQMPRMNGFEATGAIREKERARGGHTPIVAMTAHVRKEDERRCLDAGMDAFVAKPIDFKACMQVITETINKTV